MNEFYSLFPQVAVPLFSILVGIALFGADAIAVAAFGKALIGGANDGGKTVAAAVGAARLLVLGAALWFAVGEFGLSPLYLAVGAGAALVVFTVIWTSRFRSHFSLFSLGKVS